MIRYDLWPPTLCLIEQLIQNDSYCGATHIQKALFLVQELTGLDLDLNFKLYHHGPYSFALREVLDELEASEAVKANPNPPYGPKYTLTDSGYGFWNQFEPDDFDPLPFEFVAGKITNKGVAELEAYGTAALVCREMPNSQLDDWVAKLLHYKPHIDKVRAHEAFEAITSWKQDWHNN